MARYLGPKHKLSRREGANLTGTRSRSLERRLQTPPGGMRVTKRRVSDYARQLRAKQRIKREFGLLERQFRNLVLRARGMPGPTGANLLQLLERRLDNVVYRAGFAPTRPLARQLVSHRHILVNGQKVGIPSYLVSVGERIALTPRAGRIPVVREMLDDNRAPIPHWLAREGDSATVVELPTRADSPADFQEDLVVEFYAR